MVRETSLKWLKPLILMGSIDGQGGGGLEDDLTRPLITHLIQFNLQVLNFISFILEPKYTVCIIMQV